MEYLNLNLEAYEYKREGEKECFRVRVTQSPAGEQKPAAAEAVCLSPDIRPRLRRLEKRNLSSEEMIALGEDLGAALFPPAVRSLYSRSIAQLQDDQGLRIRLMIDSFALSDVAWEYVYLSDPNTPPTQKRLDGFLVFNPRLSLVRYQQMGQRPGKLDPPAGKLRFVAVLSNPPGTPELDLVNEEKNLRDALNGQSQIDPSFQINKTIGDLEKALLPRTHIFHFSGHGSFRGALGETVGDEEGEGTLSFVSKEPGKSVDFPALKLAMNLAGAGVRFAMLGACESGKVDQVNAWTGIAPALTKAGVPAVLGMQFKIRDPNAIAFSRILYQALTSGLSIDEAVSKGRLSIYTEAENEDERDWGVPVLYLRTEQAILFPTAPEATDTKALGKILDKTEEELRGNLAKYQEDFQSALELIDRLSDYKDLHDILHDLQFGVFPNMTEISKRLLDTKGAVQDMRGYERDLRTAIGKLTDTLNNGKVDASESAWIEQLTKARLNVRQAIASPEPDLKTLNEGLGSISEVLGTQPAAINRQLRLAVGAMRLSDLRNMVQLVRDKLSAQGGKPEIVDKFNQGIADLTRMDSELRALMAEHDVWQESVTLFTALEPLVQNLPVFKMIWDQLKAKTTRFYTDKAGEEWADDLKSEEAALDTAINKNNVDAAQDQFGLFERDGKQRFWDVDKEIKKKCKELIEIRSKMAD
jgi:CHAT domain